MAQAPKPWERYGGQSAPAPQAPPTVIYGRPKTPPPPTELQVKADVRAGNADRRADTSLAITAANSARAADNADRTYELQVFNAQQSAAEREAKRAKEEAETLEKQRKADAAKGSASYKLTSTLQLLDQIESDANDNGGWGETGTSGAFMRGIPLMANAGKDLKGTVDTIDAAGVFTTLQEMRNTSPTGAAMGSVSDKDMELLRSSVSNLDPNMTHGTFMNSLGTARGYYEDMLKRTDPEAYAAYVAERDAKKKQRAPLGQRIGAGQGQFEGQTATRNVIRYPGGTGPGEGEDYETIYFPEDKLTNDAGELFTNLLNQGYSESPEKVQEAFMIASGGLPLTQQAAEAFARDWKKTPDLSRWMYHVDDDAYNAALNQEYADLSEFQDSFGGKADAVVRGAADALTLGFSDEIVGGLKSLGSGDYDYQVTRERMRDRGDEQGNYGYRLAGQVGGSLALPFKGGSVGLAAKQGAGYGAAYGFGSGEGIQGRATNALLGGTLGGVAGAGGEKLIQSGIVQRGLNALAPRPKPPTGGGNALVGRQATMQAAQRQGVDLIPADVGGRGIQKLTSAADQSFISSGTVAKAAGRRVEQLDKATGKITDKLGGTMAADDLGEVVRGAGQRYATTTRQEAGRMYSNAKMLAKGVRPKPVETIKRIDSHLQELASTPETSRELISELTKVKGELAKSGGIPVDAMKRIRSGLMESGLKNEKLRGSNEQRIFGDIADAIGGDVEAGLRAVGRGDAADAFNAADALWKRRVEHIDKTLEPVIGAGKSGEQVLSAMQSMAEGKGKGVRTLRGIMDMMEPSERAAVQASLINKLGKATAGAQNVAGDAFSPNTFMSNWNKLSPRGKAIMFPKEHRAALDDIAMLSERVKNTNSQYNFSGSGGVAVNAAQTVGGIGATAGTGGNLTPVILAAAIQYGGGKLLASPRVARYLARAPKSSNPKAAVNWANGLQKVVSRDPVIAADARALQQQLNQVFSESGRLAADDEQGKPSSAQPSR